jgi:nucleoside-diphosphate-sugar epimerase
MVKTELEELTGDKIGIEIKDIHDFRNYKVKTDKAKTILGFQPHYEVKDIIHQLYDNREKFSDFEN